jgi:hypothetical protein
MRTTLENLARWIGYSALKLPQVLKLTICFEILVLILELQTYFSLNLYSLFSVLGRFEAQQNYFIRLLSSFDIQQALSNIESIEVVWILLLLILGYLLVLLRSVMTSYRSSFTLNLETALSLDVPPFHKRVVLWLVTLHVYLFYPICIVANCCFMCLSMVVYVKNVDTNEDLPVLVDIDFSGFVLEQNQTQLFWLFDKSKKCFGAEYFISAVFGLCIHIANISLLIISYQMSTLYPSPRTFSYKTTWLGIFSPISFMTLGILRSLFSEFRLINSFLLFVLALYTNSDSKFTSVSYRTTFLRLEAAVLHCPQAHHHYARSGLPHCFLERSSDQPALPSQALFLSHRYAAVRHRTLETRVQDS